MEQYKKKKVSGVILTIIWVVIFSVTIITIWDIMNIMLCFKIIFTCLIIAIPTACIYDDKFN